MGYIVVDQAWKLEVSTGGADGALGTGGMSTKIIAVRTATAAGINSGIVQGQNPERMFSFLNYCYKENAPEPEGTFFKAQTDSKLMTDKMRWILSLPIGGVVVVNENGAEAVLKDTTLFPVALHLSKGLFCWGKWSE